MAEFYFPDTSTICNLAIVDRLPLLRTYLSGRGRVVEAVSREISQSARYVPHLDQLDQSEWFGDPIRLAAPDQVRGVEVTRVGSFGGTKAAPTKHLGESQTLYLLSNETRYSDSLWITDDRAAFDLARKRGLQTRSTVDVLETLVANGEIDAHTAFELCVQIDGFDDRFVLNFPDSARRFDP
jgi:predicted nucleic acid-binding protein